MGYTKAAIKGVSWLGFFRITSRGISYIRIAILARLLTPAEYGAADIALLILAITEVFTETGINIFLIQQKEAIDKYINTAWIISIFRGIIISLFIFLSARFVADFFHTPLAFSLLLYTSIVPIFRGFINPSVVKFTKDLQFHKEFLYRTTIFFVEAVVSVLFAFLWHSPLAIIVGIIAGAIYEFMLSFFLVKPRPTFQFACPLLKTVLHHGKWLTLTGIFSYLYHNGDNIVVGRMLGAGSLGIYQRAYSISMLPITEIAEVVSKVTFSVYVKVADDIPRLRRAYLKSMALVSVVVISLGVVFFLFPEIIIRIILGEQWISGAAVLQVLSVFGALRALSLASFAPFYALKRQDLVSRISFLNLLGLAITIIPFVSWWGIVGAAYAALTGTVISVPFVLWFTVVLLRDKSH